jgi:cobalt-zinc-cadmium resistance protein CzcA
MVRKLLSFVLHHRPLTFIIMASIAGFGIWSFTRLKIDAYPDVGDTEVEIATKYDGRAAEEVEKQVTIPLERELNSTPDVIDRRSKTIFGLSVIDLTFKDGTSDYFARQQVEEKIHDADLPDGVTPQLQPIWTPIAEIVRYAVEGDGRFSPMDLRTLQDWVVYPAFKEIPGVIDVTPFGGAVKQFHIITSPPKLLKYSLTLQNVIDAVQANNLNDGGGIITGGCQGYAVRGLGSFRDEHDIENVVVSSTNGIPIYVKDVASVEIAPPQPSGIMSYSIPDEKLDVKSGVQGLIVMRRGENPSEVLKEIHAKIEELDATRLPPGVHLRVFNDRTDLVDHTMHTVSRTVLEGIGIVFLVLLFFFGSMRTAFAVALTIPLSLLFAFGVMNLTGIPANLLSLGAIDFGIIVDGAVVMAGFIYGKYAAASDEERNRGIRWVTTGAAQVVGRDIFFSVGIIILAYLPIFTLQRVEGKLFSPMAYTLACAVFGSLLIALTLIPVLMSILFRKLWNPGNNHSLKRHNPILESLQRAYGTVLHRLLHHSAAVSLAGILLVIVGIVAARFVGTEFLPELDEGSINIRCFLPAAISIEEADRIPPIIRRIIGSHPEIVSVVPQLGRNDDGWDPYGPNRIEIYVGLKEYSLWTDKKSKKQLMNEIRGELQRAIPSAEFSFSQPILDNLEEAVTGSVADLAVVVSGKDLTVLRSIAEKITGIVKNVRGASEWGIEQEGDQAQVRVDIRRDRLARYGINVVDVQNMIEAAVGGKVIGQLVDGERHFDIVVRFTPRFRNSIDALRRLEVAAPSGARIPLAELADIAMVDGPTIIQRGATGDREICVRTNIHDRDQGGFVAEARNLVAKAVDLPRGYSIEWGGQFENLARARNRLLLVIPLTIFIIFVVLFILYKNARDAALVLMNVPFALAGGIAALLLRGYHFNVSAGVGFVSLFGVSVMAGVLLISCINRMREERGSLTAEMVHSAAFAQFRPIIAVMLPALLGLLPAALATGIGSDIQRPMATVIVGGLLSSMVLTLFVLPSLYLLLGKNIEGKDKA